MDRAIELAAVGAHDDVAQPVGRLRDRAPADGSKGPPSRRAAPTPRSSPWPRPATGARAPPSSPPSSRAPTTAARRPCADAIVAAGIARVVVGIEDPDPHVRGTGIAALRAAGVEVEVGVRADEVRAQLAPYLKHRTTGRP